MARINIQEKWWTDPRRTALAKAVKSQELADGIVINFWRTAQEFWKKKQQGIPEGIFRQMEHHCLLLQCEIAVQFDGMIYAKGGKKNFDWLFERLQQSSKGGINSAAKRRSKINNLVVANGKQTSSEREANANLPIPIPIPIPIPKKERINTNTNTNTITTGTSENVPAVANRSSLKRRQSTASPVFFQTVGELISSFDAETINAWSLLYPDKSYLQRQSIKAFDYYRTNSQKMPRSLKGWKRALNHWFESDWHKHVKGITAVDSRATDWDEVFKTKKEQQNVERSLSKRD